MTTEPYRIVAVFGPERQGSGYLLSPNLVLTAAHVVEGGGAVRAVAPHGVGAVSCTRWWSRHDAHCDLAILRADEPLLIRELSPAQIGFADQDEVCVLAGAFAIGYPDAARDASNRLDTEQLVGTIKYGTGVLGNRPVLDSLHYPPAPRIDETSPWAGFSGAPVFHDGVLHGIVRADQNGWQHNRVQFTPAALLGQEGPSRLPIEWVSFARPDRRFEARLREVQARAWGRVRVYGVSHHSELAESWPLDVVYLSLEAAEHRRSPQEIEPRRVEDALSGARRIVLRGGAGSGKTTLLQWLTTLAARDELPPSLSQFHDAVPVLLPVRTLTRSGGSLPPPEEFLAAVGHPLAGAPDSEGWMSRQLAAGRVLLLVDGVDEAPQRERARVRAWLDGLLTAYPKTSCLVTTRPSAVREGWLHDLEFTELDLLPMRRTDVLAFIDRWHRAARADAPAGRRERLDACQRSLEQAVSRVQDLGRLATTPLMCSLICALNVDRNGYLPDGRMALYAAALEMLLVRRDRERSVDLTSEGLAITQEQQHALLQRLAYWLIRNGRSELSRDEALRQIAHTLPSLALDDADPEQVLAHLMVRCGLLREPAPDAVDFVHRTFQDYLGAQAAVEEGDLPMLAAHAHEDQWEDVLRLAVGHARPRERAALLGDILARADAQPAHAPRLRLTAAACLTMAPDLTPAIRDRIQAATAELIPPRTVDAARELAAAGPIVLDLLPGPEGLDDETARAVVVCATTIATDRALPLLAAYTDHPSISVRGQLAYSWDRFDTAAYAEQIIARLDRAADLRIIVTTRAQAEHLAALGGADRVEFSGPAITEADIRLIPTDRLREVRLHELRTPVDRRWLASCPRMVDLRVLNCSSPAGTTTITTDRPEPSPHTSLAFLEIRGSLANFWDLLGMATAHTHVHLDSVSSYVLRDIAASPKAQIAATTLTLGGPDVAAEELRLLLTLAPQLRRVGLADSHQSLVPADFVGLRRLLIGLAGPHHPAYAAAFDGYADGLYWYRVP